MPLAVVALLVAGCGGGSSGSSTTSPAADASAATGPATAPADFVPLAEPPAGSLDVARRWLRAAATRTDLAAAYGLTTPAWQAAHDRAAWLEGRNAVVPVRPPLRLDRIDLVEAIRRGDRIGLHLDMRGHAPAAGAEPRRDYAQSVWVYLESVAGAWRVASYAPEAPPPPTRA